MKLRELIMRLKEIEKKEGDLEVEAIGQQCDGHSVETVKVVDREWHTNGVVKPVRLVELYGK